MKTVVVFVVLLVAACDPSMGEVAKQHKAFNSALKKKLAKVAAAIDKAPEPTGKSKCDVPKDLTYGGDKGIGNAELVVYDDVAKPTSDEDHDKVEISLSYMSAIMMMAAWFFEDSEHYVGQLGKAKQSSNEGMLHTIAQAKAVEYLIVSKPGEADFKAGTLHADVFVVALDDASIECSYRVSGKADPSEVGTQYEHVEVNRKTGNERVVGGHTEGGFTNNVIASLKTAFKKSLTNKLKLKGKLSH